MKIKYFQDTDTLYIEFRAVAVAETRDMDENTLLDLDADGNVLYRSHAPRGNASADALRRGPQRGKAQSVRRNTEAYCAEC